MSNPDSGATGSPATEPLPAAPTSPIDQTAPQAPPPPEVPAAAVPSAAQAETQAWPPAGAMAAPAASAVPPARARGAWIRALSPLTAGVLAGLLLLSGFGIGVVVGWQHGGGHSGPAGFGQSQDQRQLRPGERIGPGQRGFGPGQGYGRPNRQGQQGQPNLPNLPNRSAQPTPSGTVTG